MGKKSKGAAPQNGDTAAVAEADGKKKASSKAAKAGLLLSVSRCDKRLRDARLTKRVGAATAVYVAAVVETVLEAVIEAAGLRVIKEKRARIRKNDVVHAIRSTPELAKLFAHVTFSGSPHVRNCARALMTKREGEAYDAKKAAAAAARAAA